MKKKRDYLIEKQLKYQEHINYCRECIKNTSPRIYDIMMIKTTKEVKK